MGLYTLSQLQHPHLTFSPTGPSRAFFNIGTGGGGKCPPFLNFAPPPSRSVFDPIKLSLFWNSCQCNDKVGYYPWNLCERIKFWKRILRNRVLITKQSTISRRFFQKKDRLDSRPTLETYQNREFVAKFFEIVLLWLIIQKQVSYKQICVDLVSRRCERCQWKGVVQHSPDIGSLFVIWPPPPVKIC